MGKPIKAVIPLCIHGRERKPDQKETEENLSHILSFPQREKKAPAIVSGITMER